MKTIKLLLILFLYTAISSCSKEGPAGPAGAQGNANVTPNTYTVASWDNNGYVYYANFSVSALTSSIQNGGAIETFLSTDGGTDWSALPFTQFISGGSNYMWTYTTSVGNVEVIWTYNGIGLGSDPNTIYGVSSCEFKVVCIAPAAMKKYPNANWKDYKQVKVILGSSCSL